MTFKVGHELDGLIATKVMGWPIVDYHPSGPWPCVSQEIDREGKEETLLWQEPELDAVRFNPSSDISSAWKVIKKICSNEWVVSGTYDAKHPFTKCIVQMKPRTQNFTEVNVSAETVELAICLAALKFAEFKNEDS